MVSADSVVCLSEEYIMVSVFFKSNYFLLNALQLSGEAILKLNLQKYCYEEVVTPIKTPMLKGKSTLQLMTTPLSFPYDRNCKS